MQELLERIWLTRLIDQVGSSKDAFRFRIVFLLAWMTLLSKCSFSFEALYLGAHEGSQLEGLALSLNCFLSARMSISVIL